MLEDAGIKLSCVATDILGMSGAAMLDALVSGTTDPRCSPSSQGRLRAKIPALREALDGRFDADHALIGLPDPRAHRLPRRAIDRSPTQIEEQIAPFAASVELLCTIPGVEQRTAEVLIAEIGLDMTMFPTAGHLASWAGCAPATTSPPANAAPARPARAPSGCTALDGSRHGRDPHQGHLPRTPTTTA